MANWNLKSLSWSFIRNCEPSQRRNTAVGDVVVVGIPQGMARVHRQTCEHAELQNRFLNIVGRIQISVVFG